MIYMSPVILKSEKKSRLTFSAEFPFAFAEGKIYYILFSPLSGFRPYGYAKKSKILSGCEDFFKKLEVTAHGNTLTLEQYFPQEDEYSVKIFDGDTELKTLFCYALDDDLYERDAYKGDAHMHTFFSDGMESPEYVVSACREIGMDFIAVTDHHQYQPSQQAKSFWSGLKTEFLILNGEEVHSPGNKVHIVHFGGRASVNQWFTENRAEYDTAVTEKMQTVNAALSPQNQYQTAACAAVFEKIREYGGFSVLCHPMWETYYGYDIDEDITEYLTDCRGFDALELIGGYFDEGSQRRSNLYQTNYYYTRCAEKKIPVLGLSDSHGVHTGKLFGWYYTIVFAKDLTYSGICEAVRSGYSVAVEALPGERKLVYGDFRMVKYANFALNHIFPYRDSECAFQGRLMRQYTQGKATLEQLNARAGAISDYNKKLKYS